MMWNQRDAPIPTCKYSFASYKTEHLHGPWLPDSIPKLRPNRYINIDALKDTYKNVHRSNLLTPNNRDHVMAVSPGMDGCVIVLQQCVVRHWKGLCCCIHAGTWMDLKDVQLSEGSSTLDSTYTLHIKFKYGKTSLWLHRLRQQLPLDEKRDLMAGGSSGCQECSAFLSEWWLPGCIHCKNSLLCTLF